VLDDDERRELGRLRQEVARLRATPPPGRRRIRWASLAAGVLLVLGCSGVPASVLAVWTHRQVTDNDRFVATVSPVIHDPLVQSALANRISTEVLGYVDVQQIADEAIDALAVQGMRPQLVERLHDLTGPLADGVAGLVHDRVGQLVASEEFTAAWNRALQVTHEQANAVLSGQAGAMTIDNGMVVLDLGPFIAAAKQKLVDSGFAAAARIPEAHPTVDLFAAPHWFALRRHIRRSTPGPPGFRGSRCCCSYPGCPSPGTDGARCSGQDWVWSPACSSWQRP